MDEFLKNPIFATHILAAAGSATLATALTCPLDAIKTLIQVGSGSTKQLTSGQIVQRIQYFSGYSGFYSGFPWLASGRVASHGARFATYELLTALCKDGREDNYVYVPEAFLAGMASGAMESLINSPFELAKVRRQVASAVHNASSVTSALKKSDSTTLNSKLLRRYLPEKKLMEQTVNLLSILSSNREDISKGLKNYPWMMTGSGKPPAVSDVSHIRDIIRLEGLGSLWRGLRTGLARDSVFGGMFFSIWQFVHLTMLEWKAVQMNPPPRSDDEVNPLSPLSMSLAAGFSGSVAAAASHGFDTARSRSQCTVLPKYLTLERRYLKWKTPGSRFERITGIHPGDRNLLLRGISWRMARSGIASFMAVGGYFLAVNHVVPKMSYAIFS